MVPALSLPLRVIPSRAIASALLGVALTLPASAAPPLSALSDSGNPPRRPQTAIILLRHQNAADLAPVLQRLQAPLAFPAAPARSASYPGRDERLSTTRALPVDSQLALRDLRLRLLRVNANRPEDDNDDEVVVAVRTAVESRELTIRELTIGYIGDYEIHVLNVVPNLEKPGHGTARIHVRYAPR